MNRKEWQSLHDELTALNKEFNAKIISRQEITNKKKLLEIDKSLAYITELAYCRITNNEYAYHLMVFDLRNDESLIAGRLSQITDITKFSDAISAYLSRVEKRF